MYIPQLDACTWPVNYLPICITMHMYVHNLKRTNLCSKSLLAILYSGQFIGEQNVDEFAV